MEKFIGKNVLITTDQWFYGPDCQNYRCVWGKLIAIRKVDEIIGFPPNRPNVNWVFEIGNMLLYGCQVKYIVLSENKPDATKKVRSWTSDAAHGYVEFETPCPIYIAE